MDSPATDDSSVREHERATRKLRRPTNANDDRRIVLRTGRRFAMGTVDGSYAVWDRARPDEPVALFGPDAREGAYSIFTRLEAETRSAHRRARSDRWGRLLAILAVVVAIATPIAAMAWSEYARPSDGARDAGGGASRYEDAASGLSFRVPNGWEPRTTETGVELIDPGRGISVSIAPLAGGGDLEAAAHDVASAATASWGDVTIERVQHRLDLAATNAGVSGTAIDPAGRDVRFLAIAMERSGATLGVFVRVDAGWEPTDELPAIRDVLSSLRAS